MALALNGGHVSRALDFYNKEGKYFIIGGSQPWRNEPTPDDPNVEDFKLVDVIGLKKVDEIKLVVPDNDKGTIVSRDQKWRAVADVIETNVSAKGVVAGEKTIYLTSIGALKQGDRVRINNLYEGTIESEIVDNNITLDTPAPVDIPAGSIVEGGAIVEDAKHVYVKCYLEYDSFPLNHYRQIGLCTGVVPKSEYSTEEILLSAAFSSSNTDEYESLGILEVLDNRSPIPRDKNMKELISMIIEF